MELWGLPVNGLKNMGKWGFSSPLQVELWDPSFFFLSGGLFSDGEFT